MLLIFGKLIGVIFGRSYQFDYQRGVSIGVGKETNYINKFIGCRLEFREEKSSICF